MLEGEVFSFDLVGTVLEEDVFAKNLTVPLLKKGTLLNERHIIILQSHLDQNNLRIETCSLLFSYKKINVEVLEENYKQSLGQLKSIFEDLDSAIHRDAVSAPLQKIEHAYRPMLNTIVSEDGHFELLNLLRKDDEFTYVHSLNVAVVASIIGKLLGVEKEEILLLGETGILHDIGKLAIPLSVLKKEGKLNDEEWKLIRDHPISGVKILENLGETRGKVLAGTLMHHERLDGTGYPHGLLKDEIPIHAQIISIADTYDAITAIRPYKGERSPLVAANILMEETLKGKFNAKITVPFTKYLMDQFVGEEVLLNTGERAVVTYIYKEHPHRPLINLGDLHYIDLRVDHTRSIIDVA